MNTNTIPSTQAAGLFGAEPRRRRVLDAVYSTIENNPNQNRDQLQRITKLSHGSLSARLHELLAVGSIGVSGESLGDKNYEQRTFIAIKPPPSKMPPVDVKDPLRKAIRLAGRGSLVYIPVSDLKRLNGLIVKARAAGAEIRVTDGPGWALVVNGGKQFNENLQ